MKNFGLIKICSVAAAALIVTGSAHAATTVITFDSSNNGQNPIPSTYQPLLNGYAGDGGALGIRIGWGGSASSSQTVNPFVTDHTPGSNGTGYVAFDNRMQTSTFTFSKPVDISSFFFSNFDAGTAFQIIFRGYTNAGDVVPAVELVRNYDQPSGYTWIEETGLAGHAIKAFSYSGTNFKQLDDFTVAAASVAGTVPEPATWAMMIAGFGVIGASLRSRKRQTVRASLA